ncbi:MAG TPA: hypothetical protein VL400_25555 [Polyangiaceae bacterium]|jgi:hypothetical protein|nr:hypothetical protein [Polyangiaceae bacterium]
MRLGRHAVYNFRPGSMKPVPGQKNLERSHRVMLPVLPDIEALAKT